jgi:signal transduction histidine kinase
VEVWWEAAVSTEPAALVHRTEPQVLAALGAINRVARALVGSGSLAQLAERALSEMRDALGLDLVVLYLPAPGEQPSLRRYVTSAGQATEVRARDDVSFDDEAWRLAIASGAPLLFREEASWLVLNPFEPPAESWLVLPLVSEGSLVGAVVAAAPAPLPLDRTAATVLSLLGDLLAAGIATARLRRELQGAEIERERMRVAAEMHDGLAQDLALAMRELALLESDPPPEQAQASTERLRQAVAAAHRVARARLEDLSVTVPLGGIRAAVEDVCAHRGRGLPLTIRSTGPAVDVSPETAAVVIRVLTEALANVRRHAQATEVDVAVAVENDRLTLTIQDDGVGFSVADAGGPGDGHFGLTLMRERARGAGGSVTLRSGAGGGACITLRVPVR